MLTELDSFYELVVYTEEREGEGESVLCCVFPREWPELAVRD